MKKIIRIIGAVGGGAHASKAKIKNGFLKIGLLLLCCFLLSIILPNGAQSDEKEATPSKLAAPTGLRVVNATDAVLDTSESDNNSESQASPNDSAESEPVYQELEPPKNLRIVIEY